MKFTVINESFQCEHCKKVVPKHLSGSCRNHCSFCLHSKHLDLKAPGDRKSTCHALMAPIGLDQSKKKGFQIVHRCLQCGYQIKNITAPDDNSEELLQLAQKTWLDF